MALTRLYRGGKLASEGFPISEVSEVITGGSATVWFDLRNPGHEELQSVREELGLHPLAMEDAQHPHQRPKLDRYPSHLFVTAYSMHLEVDSGQLDYAEVDAVVTGNALVTVRKTDKFDIEQVLNRWNDRADLAGSGVGYLLPGPLDYVVETTSRRSRAGEIEALEDELFDHRPQDRQTQRRTFELRKSLDRVHRADPRGVRRPLPCPQAQRLDLDHLPRTCSQRVLQVVGYGSTPRGARRPGAGHLGEVRSAQ